MRNSHEESSLKDQVKRLTIEEAVRLLNIHERTFKRWCQNYEEDGAQGLVEQRLDKIAHNELALADVVDIQEADAFLEQVYLKAHNEKFCVKPSSCMQKRQYWSEKRVFKMAA